MGTGLGFYSDQTITALTGSPVAFNWDGKAKNIVLTNDDTSGTNLVVYGFGATDDVAGKLKFGESVSLDGTNIGGIFLSFAVGAPAYRLMVVAER